MMRSFILGLSIFVIVLSWPAVVQAQDPVEDVGTHDRLDSVNSNLDSINNNLITIDGDIGLVVSRLLGLHGDLAMIYYHDLEDSAELAEIDSHLEAILEATLAISNGMSAPGPSGSYETRIITPTGYATASQTVIYRYEYSSGDKMIAIGIVVLILIEAVRLLFAATRGTNL